MSQLIDKWMKRYEEVYLSNNSDTKTIDIIMKESGYSEVTICAWYEQYYYNHQYKDMNLNNGDYIYL